MWLVRALSPSVAHTLFTAAVAKNQTMREPALPFIKRCLAMLARNLQCEWTGKISQASYAQDYLNGNDLGGSDKCAPHWSYYSSN